MNKFFIMCFTISIPFIFHQTPLFARDIYQVKAETREALDNVSKSKRDIQQTQETISIQKKRIESLTQQLSDMNKELESLNEKLAAKQERYLKAEEQLKVLTDELNSTWDTKKLDN
jgi:septal ring factor EnvC (AmiA/AmiB activator)